jgi:hypothetical protein
MPLRYYHQNKTMTKKLGISRPETIVKAKRKTVGAFTGIYRQN